MGFYLNQRLSVSSQICTIHYIGEVEGTSGSWIGVEWDDPTRGKHDGSYQGKRYYTCLRKSQTAASFIRPSRVIDAFLSFSDALESKHIIRDTATDKTAGRATYFSSKLAEEVGFEKFEKRMANLHDLRTVSLEGFCIKGILQEPCLTTELSKNWLAHIESISLACPNLTHLDIRRNLLESMLDVQGLCSALPELRSLDISGNRLWRNEVLLENSKSSLSTCFRNMNDLSMNFTFVPWSIACRLVGLFPSLQRLAFAYNGVDEINELPPVSVSALVLTGNNFKSFAQIAVLSNMTSLRTLILHDCPLHEDGDPRLQLQFENVENLDVSKTQITLKGLGNLHYSFPKLSSLRCSTGSEENNLIVIARLRDLKAINHAEISHQQRMNAELYYLSSIARELQATDPSIERTVLAEHPRWLELCGLHGKPLINRSTVRAFENSLQTRMVTLICRDYRQTDSKDPKIKSLGTFQIKLPKSFTMYRVYTHISNRLDTLPIHLNIIWETDEWDPVAHRSHSRIKYHTSAQHVSLSKGDIRVTADGSNLPWPSSDSDGSEGEETIRAARQRDPGNDPMRDSKKWVKRDVYLEKSSRELGFWIEGHEANIRIEHRGQKNLVN